MHETHSIFILSYHIPDIYKMMRNVNVLFILFVITPIHGAFLLLNRDFSGNLLDFIIKLQYI